jgi:hypothetical protein
MAVLLHTWKASARRNDALPRTLALCKSSSYCTPLLFGNHHFFVVVVQGR